MNINRNMNNTGMRNQPGSFNKNRPIRSSNMAQPSTNMVMKNNYTPVEAEIILDNYVAKSNQQPKKHHSSLKLIAMFIVTHFISKKLSSYISTSNTSARGFNKYWGIALGDLLKFLTGAQKAMIVKEFGTNIFGVINESVDLSEDDVAEEAEIEDVMAMFQNKSNLLEFDKGVEMGSLNNGLTEDARFAFSLKYHVAKTSNFNEFLDSVRHYVEVYKESELTDLDIDKLEIHYERYA